MTGTSVNKHEQAAANAFGKQAPLFDQLYQANTIIRYKRKRVREHVEQFLQPKATILELNAGTGDDAIYFAQQGHHVHATDISATMQEMLVNKVVAEKLEKNISNETCSFTELENLSHQGPYDHIFSNFAGLNCTGRLEKVLDSFTWLLKPGGTATLVILPKFCLWEFLLLFKGRFKTAFRRFAGRKGARAHIEGAFFRCWYYNPSFIRKHLKNSFEVVSLEGLCCIVPPSYIEQFAEKHPRLYQYLEKKENRWKSKWPWKLIGDYYIITVRKKAVSHEP
ncbi:MAG TPA: class I SAM-dependent methyltransferase [Chitinophagaceae bacterium]